MDHDAGHVPVMLEEVIEHLSPHPGQVVLDGTAGGGGHAAEILRRLEPDGCLLLLDRDRETLERLRARLGRRGNARFFHANYCDFDQALDQAGYRTVDGALLDLGVSSLQLAEAERGFSFDRPGPLDMRFDRTDALTAEAVINTWPAERLAQALREYGDQPFANRIARAIVAARPLRRTDALAEVVASAVPARWRRQQTIHPATRVFQAVRIAVNDEFGSLETFLDKIFGSVSPGGRVVILSFHSGEDRIVKHRFRAAAAAGVVCLPVAKPVRPTPVEVQANPRARSARLRVAQRLPTAGS